jgi:dUTP pyrophosphatase
MPRFSIRIKRFDKELPLPARQTSGAIGYDLCARLDTTIASHSFGRIPLNVAIEFPPDCWLLLAARSSCYKHGLMPSNGIGIFDHDFKGDNDEYMFLAYNPTDAAVTVVRGTRIAQLVPMAQVDVGLVEVERLEAPNRGGYGSTGAQ